MSFEKVTGWAVCAPADNGIRTAATAKNRPNPLITVLLDEWAA
jgi:hypothetical protein